MTTIFDALTVQTRRLGDRPAVVFNDAGTGERTELSFATLHNWVCKTANLLVDELHVGLGDEVALDVPLHWMVPVLVLATWATGAAVRLEPGGQVTVGHDIDDDGPQADLLIGSGMGGRPVVDARDALTVTDILRQPDDFVDDPGDPGAWAIQGRRQDSMLDEMLEPAPGVRILHAGGRVLEETVFAVARTLPAGISLVIARGYDEDGLRSLARQEGTT